VSSKLRRGTSSWGAKIQDEERTSHCHSRKEGRHVQKTTTPPHGRACGKVKGANLAERKENLQNVLRVRDSKTGAATETGDDNAYAWVLALFLDVFARNRYDVVVLVVRRAFALFMAFKDILEDELGFEITNYTNSDTLDAWWIAQERKPETMCVFDDTSLYGTHLRNLVERLQNTYGFEKDKIDVRVFYRREENDYNDIRRKHVSVFGETATSSFEEKSFSANKDFVQRRALDFVEVIHAAATPYVSYLPAFRIPFEVAGKLFNNTPPIEEGEELERNHFAPPFNNNEDWRFANLTIEPQYHVSVEAGCLLPTESNVVMRKGLNQDLQYEALSAVRIYIHHELEEVLIIPHHAFEHIRNGDVLHRLVGNNNDLLNRLKALCAPRQVVYSDHTVLLHKLIRYLASYILGKNFMGMLGLNASDYLVGFGGLDKGDSFFKLLNDNAHCYDLMSLWKLFADPEHIFLENDDFQPEKSLTPKDEAKLKQLLLKYKEIYSVNGLMGYLPTVFNAMSEYYIEENRDRRFPGICPQRLRRFVEESIGISIDEWEYKIALIRLGDYGCVVVKISLGKNGSVGTVAMTGELDCCFLHILDPGLAYALKEVEAVENNAKGTDEFWRYVAKYAESKNPSLNETLKELKEGSTSFPRSDLEELSPSDDTAWFFAELGGLYADYCKQPQGSIFQEYLKKRGVFSCVAQFVIEEYGTS
jgi:hypothetical protein